MKKPNTTENILGWIGVAMVLVAYALNALGFVSSTGLFYIVFNLVGSLGVGYIAIRYRNYQSALVNILWVIIALIALSKLLVF